MQKLVLLALSLAGFALALGALPAGAAPKNATLLQLDCGQAGEVDAYVQLNSSGAAIFGASGEGGRAYLIQSLEVRGYPGALTVEPTDDPVFSFEKEYGNRTGFSESIDCSGSLIEPETGEGPGTIFFDVTLLTK